LLLDVMAGDATLFMRRDSVEASWRWIAPILNRWQDADAPPVCKYAAGDWGPVEATQLIERGGRRWRMP
jgi:glucose-6-phosphate 1-dehydrogenase